MSQSQPRTLFQKIWDAHVIRQIENETLLYVDRCLIHEGARQALDKIDALGLDILRPHQVIACSDHYVPTLGRNGPLDKVLGPEFVAMIRGLERDAKRHGFPLFGLGDPRQGILHVSGPEQGITLPGMVIAGGDSHTSTHGAFGAFAFGIGSGDVAHVLATQTILEQRPATLRILIEGNKASAVTAKDLILATIARIGLSGTGHVIEYAGSAITALKMDERMTVCNMSIEAGARAGLIAPDETTFTYLKGRPFAPQGPLWDQAVAAWRDLVSDEAAAFDRTVTIDAGEVAPMVTWGTSPAYAIPVSGRIPDPAAEVDAEVRSSMAAALDYMGLAAGMPIAGVPVDIVFIGSCTNGRIEDLRQAAEVAKRGKAKIPAWVVPGSTPIKLQAEAEGLDRIFKEAGFQWRDSGCSLCTAINGVDVLNPGQRCASTSNRNFRGRQGPGSRTHLMSPPMAAAAAIAGCITDARQLA